MDVGQHAEEIRANREAWDAKPLLRDLYDGFYGRIREQIDFGLDGSIVELGSGIGNLKLRVAEAVSTDLFPHPWLDLACDGYALPFRDGALSNLILFDVFHHLRRPLAFLDEARRALVGGGRLILFEPYISATSALAYGPFHHEPIGWRSTIDTRRERYATRDYYAAQGNATRIFFRDEIPGWSQGWIVRHRARYADLSYLLSGGFSKPALYPRRWLPAIRSLDGALSRLPRLFASRCLVCLEKPAGGQATDSASMGGAGAQETLPAGSQ
ncbi:MAG: methyltransferase domain-containing protein [Gammaproteobacteria bacterium]|nr:methyltransferase domain-containing protein [Gammaproteobacteria bacterium]